MDTSEPAADERALIGAILNGYPDMHTLTVTDRDFGQIGHAFIWQAFRQIDADGNLPDRQLVRHYMGDRVQQLPGGDDYLANLPDTRPDNAPMFANLVSGHSARRRLADLGTQFHQLVGRDVDTVSMLDEARQWIDELLEQGQPETMTDVWQSLVDRLDRGVPNAAPLPWQQLDRLVGGLQPGTLTTVGARPSIGKSIVLENIATHIGRTGRRVLMSSLEMSAVELMQRTTAYTAGVSLSRFRQQLDYDDPDRQKIMQARDRVLSANMAYDDRPGQSLADIRARAWQEKRAATRQGTMLGAIVVDYLGLVTPSDRRMSRQQQLGEITGGLKQLSKALGVPIIIASQLNRLSEYRKDSTPMLADLREAGDIEQDSDTVILLDEDAVQMDSGEWESTDEVRMIVAKNRNGPTGETNVRKWGSYARMDEQGAA